VDRDPGDSSPPTGAIHDSGTARSHRGLDGHERYQPLQSRGDGWLTSERTARATGHQGGSTPALWWRIEIDPSQTPHAWTCPAAAATGLAAYGHAVGSPKCAHRGCRCTVDGSRRARGLGGRLTSGPRGRGPQSAGLEG